MKKKAKKKQTVRQRELKRIKQIMYRGQKRGLTFEITIEDIEKLSTQKLKKIKPITLQKQSYGYFQGDKLRGDKVLKAQNKEEALKRKREKDGSIPFNDAVVWGRGYVDKILQNLYEICDTYDTSINPVHQAGAQMLREMLDNEIATYGRKAVALSAEQNAKSNLSNGENVIFASTQEGKEKHLDDLRYNIRGSLPSDEELENDNYYGELYNAAQENNIDEDGFMIIDEDDDSGLPFDF